MENKPLTNSKKLKCIIFIFLLILFLLTWFLIKNQTSTPSATFSERERPTRSQNQEPESNTAYAQVDSLNTLNSSDEIWAIEADLDSTDLSSLLLEVPALETELGF